MVKGDVVESGGKMVVVAEEVCHMSFVTGEADTVRGGAAVFDVAEVEEGRGDKRRQNGAWRKHKGRRNER